ncbi:amino acid ABC transporter permease [Demequina muriae]|uniref:Amino acid ABC transporter permease n=1 Tax=Demequina muriae TaxID=3051664 RepID=A0ABT8GDR9_9MICO|nr:amino acid ABC transporter permease [Demequina sp. EGI L300058]MDN4479575.1 amino acid ABC transporter permease [Demequina sp. EGI L300058]
MSEQHVLFDIPGPKAKRRDVYYNIIFTAVILVLVGWVVWTAWQRGIFDDRWAVLWDPPRNQTASDVWRTLLWSGLVQGTLKAVAIAVPVVAALAVILTVARQAPYAGVRWAAYGFTHVFRGIPVLLIMYFGVIALNLDPLWAVVLGLVVYNTAVVAEILRAGIAALPSGQREAGLSIGLTPLATLLTIQLPQAVRIMLPALISQIVVLLKDTSLGFIIAYVELLTTVKNLYNYFGDSSKVPFVLVGAVIYIAVNMSVARLATWLEARMRQSPHVAHAPDPGGAAL